MQQKSHRSIIIRTIIIAFSSVMLVWSLCNKITEGTYVGIFGFGGIIAACVFQKPLFRAVKFCWSKIALRITILALGSVVAVLAGMCIFFSVNMLLRVNVPINEPKAVIVLGCLVKGEEPSPMLNARMNAALDVYEKAPDTLLVVCGGKGNGESISEAEAMRRYFAEHNVPAEKIICEDNSTSTEENIFYASEILKEMGIIDNITIVTNEFHQYRAYVFAKRAGISTGSYSARTYWLNLPNYWLREWAGLFHQLVFSNKNTV